MNRATAIVLVTNLLLGWLIASLFAGAALTLNALSLAFVIMVILWLLRVAGRADVLYAVIGLVAGVLIGLLVPQLRWSGDTTLLALAMLIFAYKA